MLKINMTTASEAIEMCSKKFHVEEVKGINDEYDGHMEGWNNFNVCIGDLHPERTQSVCIRARKL